MKPSDGEGQIDNETICLLQSVEVSTTGKNRSYKCLLSVFY